MLQPDQLEASHVSPNTCLHHVPIFSQLTDDQLQEITKVTVSARFEKGELIFTAGQQAESLFIIHKGRVKIYRTSEAGKEQVLRILEPGNFMGETALFGHSLATGTAEALESTQVCLIQKSRMQQLVLKFPNMAVKLLEQFSERLTAAEEQIEQLSLYGVEQRVARMLIQLAMQGAGRNGTSTDLVLSISKRDLASLAGTTQETLSRKLAVFQAEGWIRLIGQRRVVIVDKDQLAKVGQQASLTSSPVF